MSKKIDYLIKGYKSFRQQYFESDKAFYKNLVATGQQPKYLIIACSDSRVDPAIILNCKPGDLFVIRNVANLIPPCEFDSHYHGTSAALEFGICSLGIKDIIILGHSQCGGMIALLENYKKNTLVKTKSFLAKWVEIAKSACDKTVSDHPNLSTVQQTDICAQHSLLYSLKNLNTFPWIKEGVSQSTLSLHAWYFDLSTGKINFFNALQQEFEALDHLLEQKND
jgi:carbonic anhydrase